MRIGILADIHEDVEGLSRALTLIRRERVSQLVVLGDLFYTGQRVTETADLLLTTRRSSRVQSGIPLSASREHPRNLGGFLRFCPKESIPQLSLRIQNRRTMGAREPARTSMVNWMVTGFGSGSTIAV